ncbi:MAG: hypothetical protein COB20_06930 [SAR86 cluster bacterium]|uniref:Thymidine phosphorylase n=1 Tax=SAR86 cluster bacterium TaxID=2030880 RepID=A0A2A4X7L1_9GAMM|nr:MAG: hypothetical protein COB20_06930 [SAR86 cluster bacterium]
MKEVLDKVRLVAVRTLTRHVVAALENSTLQIEAQAMQFTNAKLPPIREESRAIAERFMTNLNAYFDALTSFKAKEEEEAPDFDKLSLVDHDYLEAIIAMEGMVTHVRNSDRPEYVRLTTRLNSLFPNTTIDETNNPLDPEQIGDCFNESIRPLGLKAHYLLTIYREFNKAAFHNMESCLAEANEVLIEIGVMPNLDMKARNRELAKQKREAERADTERSVEASQARTRSDRSQGKTEITRKIQETVESAKPEQNQAEMFSMMQTLVRGLADQQRNQSALPVNMPVTTADLQVENENLKQQQTQLMSVLNNLQSRLNLGDTSSAPPNSGDSSIGEFISRTLEESSSAGDIGAIDARSSDVINLVTLLYKEIWNDDSLPLVMKELIGRTQISTMKIALNDTDFFDDDQHPSRVILNEFAMAGIAWTEKELLESDPVFNKVRELVERLLAEENADKKFVQGLIDELREIRNDFSLIDAALEQRIRETDDPSERLEDVHELVRQKVRERVLRDDLDPSIQSLLDTHFHNFLVKLILREGPGGSSWKPVMSTIDVLLWTVKADKLPGDKSRFEKINPRLLDNIEKALEIGGASKSKRKKILRQLKQVQQYSFHIAEIRGADRLRSVDGSTDTNTADGEPRRERREPPSLPRDDPYLRRIDKLPIGTWFEFKGAAGVPVRCALASKIDSIDKLFFVNSKGEKAVELTRMRLARELKAGSVKILTEGSLVGRAMESVISNLRNSAQSQEPDAAAN